ncbi:hypothetical protein OsI_17097 [Oryza sativa Indica Group]|uniref:Isopenicillin N synthase-like Fe(2+) 2OG dioxygenase domain-containing protein n=1 Tax=Oryza sativa subsp. indica TaxID=39946 RepID=A2XWR4_ORYSI|nr:hypothetical protein OsI_17097 [Oryza sativa Indica Group]
MPRSLQQPSNTVQSRRRLITLPETCMNLRDFYSRQIVEKALSNGTYKSVWHRAVVNAVQERMSVASFMCPCNSAVISPARKLVADGDAPVYRSFTYDEYYKKFWSRNLDQEHCLELFKGQ